MVMKRLVRSSGQCISIPHHTHTRLTAVCPGLPGWAGTRKVKPIWILLEQETVSGSGISWAICKSAPRSRQITTPAPTTQFFYRPDALPAAQPTASKHWRPIPFHISECQIVLAWSANHRSSAGHVTDPDWRHRPSIFVSGVTLLGTGPVSYWTYFLYVPQMHRVHFLYLFIIDVY